MAEHTPANDVTFDCKSDSPNNWIIMRFALFGGILNPVFIAAAIRFLVRLRGEIPSGAHVRADTAIYLSFMLHGEGVIAAARRNWVGWSKIGEASFVLDVTNDAGFRPMSWSGEVYAIKQLGKGAVVYGSDGITLMSPAQQTFAFRDLAFIGLLARDAVCGDDTTHYFIDKKFQLWKLNAEGATYLDFSEHLRVLVNPVMHYDAFVKHVLISDSAHGFVLVADKLGSGYTQLSGYVYESGSLLIASPQLVEYEPLSFTTDILDFGRRSQKTLTSVQVGTDAPEQLEVAYDYRLGIRDEWHCTRYVRLNTEGIMYLPCVGIEFRIKLRARRITRCDVDYLNISFKTTDQRFSRSAYVSNLARSAFAGSVDRAET